LAGFVSEDQSTSWAQVSAWWQAHDLTRNHLAVLRQARETIVRAWPPQVNQASAVFLEHVDALIASMENTVVAAEANGRALKGILTVLENTKETLADLHERWQRQERSQWTQATSAMSALGGSTAGMVDGAMALAASDEKARLNAQAQAVMRATDQAAYEYLPHLVIPQWVPPPPDHGWRPAGGGDTGGSPGGSGSLPRPVIPRPAPPAAAPDSTTGGPALTGGGSPPGQGTAPPLGGPVRQPGPGTGAPDSGNPASVSPWVQTPVGRVLRSGAVLGAPVESVEPGHPGGVAGRSPVREPARSGVSGVGPEGALLGGGMGAGRVPDRRGRRTVPPDTEWPVPKGVPPVLEPPPEREVRHDPGPGVIGIDRFVSRDDA
jgi:hypothetical protein